MRKKQEKETPEGTTDYCCPCCDKPLHHQWGNQTFPGDRKFGVMLFCRNGDPAGRIHPQEVSGHGNFRRVDEKDEAALQRAYAVIQARFCGAKLENEGETMEIPADELL